VPQRSQKLAFRWRECEPELNGKWMIRKGGGAKVGGLHSLCQTSGEDVNIRVSDGSFPVQAVDTAFVNHSAWKGIVCYRPGNTALYSCQARRCGMEHLRLHHYSTRSVEECQMKASHSAVGLRGAIEVAHHAGGNVASWRSEVSGDLCTDPLTCPIEVN
jgi:hypothetical protein